jgi:hypothetical protein
MHIPLWTGEIRKHKRAKTHTDEGEHGPSYSMGSRLRQCRHCSFLKQKLQWFEVARCECIVDGFDAK